MHAASLALLFLTPFAASLAPSPGHVRADVAVARPSASEPSAPRGVYIEARTASVFAGACHYNSELVTSGGEALLAWRFDGGEAQGKALAGTRVVALVAADRNLALEGARAQSVLYVDGPDAGARAAAVALVRARHGAQLGRVRALERAELCIEREGEDYAVAVAGIARLEGRLLPDRACCTMPLARWYPTLSQTEESIVGRSERFEHAGSRWLEQRWSRSGHNDAQVGSFAW